MVEKIHFISKQIASYQKDGQMDTIRKQGT